MGPIYSIGDFVDMLRRRALLIILATAVGCVLTVLFALSQPHMYQSSEVIQIEQPKIADNLAPSTVDGSAARRLQLIEQQLMARDSLLAMVDEFGLFADQPDLLPADKVYLIRSAVTITGVAAVREGALDDGAIAVLTITATMGTPENAQLVAREFANRTRALSAAQRQEQTLETLAFFERQEQDLVAQIASLERELAAFRRQNDVSIESNIVLLQSELTSLNDAILDLDREIIAAQLARNRLSESDARAATIAREEEALDAELDTLTTQRQLLQERRAALSQSVETTPEVDRELAKYDRRLTLLQQRLDGVTARRNEAQVAVSLEANARGERMITIEAAELPDYPVTMSRRRRAMLGGAASAVGAVFLAFLMELRNPVMRTAVQMERETGLRAVISVPQAPKNRRRRGLSQLWQSRREVGQQGRAARLARNPGTRRG